MTKEYVVVYKTFDVISHMIRYSDFHKALNDAIYWKVNSSVWVSEIEIYKGNDLIAVLTGREI